jgi:hypothetical protein
VGHVVRFGAFGHEMSMHNFSCSGGTDADPRKVVSGHVMLNLCFCIQVDLFNISCYRALNHLH